MERFNNRERASKPLLWIGIGSIIMALAGMTSIRRESTTLVANEQWITALPPAFMYSTIVVVIIGDILVGQVAFSNGNIKTPTPALAAVLFGSSLWLQERQ